jgi:hypothetical protein
MATKRSSKDPSPLTPEIVGHGTMWLNPEQGLVKEKSNDFDGPLIFFKP